MGAPDTSIDLPGMGKLALAPAADAPLLLVFGGINVGGQPSGVYMWPYLSGLTERFHIFVALNPQVSGTQSYRAVTDKLKEKSITPSKQILYLFSGGYLPGMSLLGSTGASTFASIFLVDIWMGSATVAKFYKALVDVNGAQTRYIYTSFGADSEATRDYIVKKLGSRADLIPGGSMKDHLSTNTKAVSYI